MRQVVGVQPAPDCSKTGEFEAFHSRPVRWDAGQREFGRRDIDLFLLEELTTIRAHSNSAGSHISCSPHCVARLDTSKTISHDFGRTFALPITSQIIPN